jgi:hypothetical protein
MEKTTDNNNKILDLLRRTPLLRKAQEMEARDRLARRREIAEEIEVLTRERDTDAQAKRQATEAIECKLTVAREAVARLEADHRTTRAQRIASIARADLSIGRHRAELIETCDARIGEEVEYWMDRENVLMGKEPERQPVASYKSLATDRVTVEVASNHEALSEALRYVRGARRTVEGWRAVADYDPEEAQRLRDGEPGIGSFTVSSLPPHIAHA